MNPILQAIAADPNVSAEFRAALTYRAQCGRRREFLSQSDADAYDDGYSAKYGFDMERINQGGPYVMGWYDWEQEQQDKADAQVERYLRETEE